MTRRHWFTFLALLASCWLGFSIGQSPLAKPHAPLIGITSGNGEAYVLAIRQAGGIPVFLPELGDRATIEHYLDRLDGLLMPGGADIPPSEYHEDPDPTVVVLDEKRFQFEKAIGRAWIERTSKPLLGICLGSQWINVIRGGSLIQDIPTEVGGNHRGTRHQVVLEPKSRLRRIYGDPQFEVNSWHHQAVDTLGANLSIAARGEDGVIEAIETTDPKRFLIGVQWHPEKMLPGDARQGRLLEAFIKAAGK